jgi:hypothetical protein
MAYWSESSLGFQMQAAWGTAATNALKHLKCETPQFQPTTEVTELDLLTGQIGAEPERIVGRRSGTLTFSMPLEGMKAGYDPDDTELSPRHNPGQTDTIPHWLCLLANAMGSDLSSVSTAADFSDGKMCSYSTWTEAGVASATSTEITLDNSTASDKVKGGALIVTAASATSTSPQIGWVRAKSGQVCTLFEAAVNTVSSATANCYGTATAYASSEALDQKPLTFVWKGNATEFAYILQDCICENATINWESGAVPTIEFTFRVYDFSMDKTKGGLSAPSSFKRIPQLVGTNNGRATLGGSAKCGLASCTWTWSATITDIVCHGASQGIAGVIITDPRIRASFSVLHESTDLVYNAAGSAGNTGQHVWQSYLELGTTLSVGLYVGAQVGRIFSLLIPAGQIIEAPSIEDRDGSVAYTLTVAAGAYSGDTSDTAETAANSPIGSIARVAVA